MSTEQHAHTEPEVRRPKTGLRFEAWMFYGIALFFLVSTIIYGYFSHEWAGTIALLLTAGLFTIIGSFLAFVSRRLEGPRPEDDPIAEVSDGAGDLGFFSPGSYWPMVVAASAAFMGVAIAFWLVWLVVMAGGFLLLAVCGLVFEYQRKPAGH